VEHEALEPDDFGLGNFGEVPAAPAVPPPAPVVVRAAPSVEEDFSISDDIPPPAPPPPAVVAKPAAAAARPTLSSRVGTLAEALEEAGQISEAALLYEVQAVLSAAGR
jgi:hypothetical protein